MSEVEKLKQELAASQAENAKLKAKATDGLKFKVAPKGGIMLLGMRGFPITFYEDEWTRVFSLKQAFETFIGDKAVQAEIAENTANPKESKNKFKAIG